jgi:hypothetical protein
LISTRICTRSLASRFDRAPERDALALAAGELARLALEQALDAEDAGRLLHALGDLGTVEFAHLQAERHVVVDAHVRVQRVILEHHGDVAIHRRQIVDDFVADQDVARGDRLESRHHAQGRGLAAAGRADQHHELLVADFQVHVVDGVNLVEFLVELPNVNRRHALYSPRSRRTLVILNL